MRFSVSSDYLCVTLIGRLIAPFVQVGDDLAALMVVVSCCRHTSMGRVCIWFFSCKDIMT